RRARRAPPRRRTTRSGSRRSTPTASTARLNDNRRDGVAAVSYRRGTPAPPGDEAARPRGDRHDGGPNPRVGKAPAPPTGSRRSGAGSMTLATIRAAPCGLSGPDFVIAAAFVSLPQNSAASTFCTGPTVLSAAVPVPVIRRPLMTTMTPPLLNTWIRPNAIFHDAGAVETPWIAGSVLLLPIRSLFSTSCTRGWKIGIWRPWPNAPTAEKAEPANAAQTSRARPLRLETCISPSPSELVGRLARAVVAQPHDPYPVRLGSPGETSSGRDPSPASRNSSRSIGLMQVAITGATGLIGRRLVRALVGRGDEVAVLTRDPARAW